MVAEPTPEYPVETSNAVWLLLGAAGGFILVFWLGFIVVSALTTESVVIFPEQAPAAAPGSDLSEAGAVPVEEAAAPPAGGADGLTVVATEFAFQHEPAHAPGAVQLSLVNDGVVFHNLEVVAADGTVVAGLALEAEAGEEDTGEIELAPGTYTLVCTVPGHREAGMESTLTVGG